MNDRLSKAASAVLRIRWMHQEAACYDAGFDGGEWSGPAHARMEREETERALVGLGFTPRSYNDALIERTSERYAHYQGLLIDDVFDEEAEWEARTERLNQ